MLEFSQNHETILANIYHKAQQTFK